MFKYKYNKNTCLGIRNLNKILHSFNASNTLWNLALNAECNNGIS